MRRKKFNYESIAKSYAAVVDSKPIHVYYERPCLWSLLPDNLQGLKVLDVGCGSGWYAEQLLKAGCEITAIDNSPTMIELTQQRVNHRGNFHVIDLVNPLDCFCDEAFDLILAPLVIHYISDWHPLFKEFSRILKQKGSFIFSTHQPLQESIIFKMENYFEKTIITDYWDGIGEVKFYHHTLHEMSEALFDNGFFIEKILEPKPLFDLEQIDRDLYLKLCKEPWFLFVRTIKNRSNFSGATHPTNK